MTPLTVFALSIVAAIAVGLLRSRSLAAPLQDTARTAAQRPSPRATVAPLRAPAPTAHCGDEQPEAA